MTVTPQERDQLAGEYALGLLDGDELAQARGLMAQDAEFRALVARWNGRLVPLLDEVAPVAPSAAVWRGIERSLRGGDNVVALKQRVTVWRGLTAAATALAASLAVVVVTRPAPPPAPPASVTVPAPAPMVAMLGDEAEGMKMVASWDPANRRLMVAATAKLPADPTHAHELWVIPVDGTPRSLGTMPAGPKMRMDVAAPMAAQFGEGVMLAISQEPMGGSPTGLPTGPVIASGKLERA
ncbi:MAG: anti-sigma factor [Sphingomicrobium sp.]